MDIRKLQKIAVAALEDIKGENIEVIDTKKLTVVDRRKPNESEMDPYVRYRLTESGISPISHPGMKGGNYLAAGIDPKKCILFVQSQVSEHAELCWLLNTVSRIGDLEKRSVLVFQGDDTTPPRPDVPNNVVACGVFTRSTSLF